jgi:hypothetical protein
MSIFNSLKGVFQRGKSDPTVYLDYMAFDIVLGEYRSCAHKVEPFTARVEQAACEGKNFTDFELHPAPYLNAYTDSMNGTTTAMDVLINEFLTIPGRTRRQNATLADAISGANKIYLNHVAAFIKAAKFSNHASAAGIFEATKVEFEALQKEYAGNLEAAAGLRAKACADKAIAEELVAKVTDALKKSSVIVAKGSKALG